MKPEHTTEYYVEIVKNLPAHALGSVGVEWLAERCASLQKQLDGERAELDALKHRLSDVDGAVAALSRLLADGVDSLLELEGKIDGEDDD
jgi:HPt (histidine-containing phosphotransfer) domain-containing protein